MHPIADPARAERRAAGEAGSGEAGSPAAPRTPRPRVTLVQHRRPADRHPARARRGRRAAAGLRLERLPARGASAGGADLLDGAVLDLEELRADAGDAAGALGDPVGQGLQDAEAAVVDDEDSDVAIW